MPVIYKAQQSPLATKAGEKLYYPRVVSTGSVGTDVIAKEIAELSSLTTGDVKNVIDNLVTVISRHLASSETVMLDGLGSFRYTLSAKGQGAATADEVSAQDATLRVRFLPTGNRQSGVTTRTMTSGVTFTKFDSAVATSSDSSTDSESSDSSDEEEVNPFG